MSANIAPHSKILIIDDEETHVRFLTTILATRGYTQVEAVTNPLDSLSGYQKTSTDLIILDLLMPGVGGMQVLRELRAMIPAESYVPIVVVTADLSPDVRREALVSGANDFVVKPYDSSEMLSRVGNLLETRDLHCRLAEQNRELNFEVWRRREMEAALQQERDDLARAKEEADRANKAKSEFLSRMSHELRTPLNAILGFGQLLTVEVTKSDDLESAQQIVKAGQHLLELIDEVLDISGIEAGRLALSLEPVRVRDAMAESLSLVRSQAASRQITFSEEVCDSPVFADSQRLKQIFVNLLSNAIKYNCEGGHITITTGKTAGGKLRLMVRDTGPGIAPENVEKIFNPFERLNAGESQIEGLGLGLAITKRLIELMDGEIGLESILGEGSAFWIELPLAPSLSLANVGVERPLQETPPSTPLGPKLLLHIEDNVSNLKLIDRALARRPEIRLLSATNGASGIELAREVMPDLILLDLHLPDINGDDVLTELLADPRTSSIPVVMISADATPSQAPRLRSLGARDYLTKPLDLRALLAVVDERMSSAGLSKILQPNLDAWKQHSTSEEPFQDSASARQ